MQGMFSVCTFTTISGTLRTSCMYPKQGLTILSEVLGISEAVLWKGLQSELHVHKPLTVTRFKKGIKMTYTHQWAPIWQTHKPVL